MYKNLVCIFWTFFLIAPKFVCAEISAFQKISISLPNKLTLTVLKREARLLPARFNVIFIPGSGCQNLKNIADAYFHELAHANILVIQKPFVSDSDDLHPQKCSESFLTHDALDKWATNTRFALQDTKVLLRLSDLPTILVGVSEGAEILPVISMDVINLHTVLVISASGLDPLESAQLQAKKTGLIEDFKEIEHAVFSDQDNTTKVGDRNLGYWRCLWFWKLQNPMYEMNFPLIHVWGSLDEFVPIESHIKFDAVMATRPHGFCSIKIFGGDHALQVNGDKGLIRIWRLLENWSKKSSNPICFNNSVY